MRELRVWAAGSAWALGLGSAGQSFPSPRLSLSSVFVFFSHGEMELNVCSGWGELQQKIKTSEGVLVGGGWFFVVVGAGGVLCLLPSLGSLAEIAAPPRGKAGSVREGRPEGQVHPLENKTFFLQALRAEPGAGCAEPAGRPPGAGMR